MESWTRKLAKADEDANFKLAKKVGNSKYEAYTFKFHGNYGFNASDWLANDSTNTGSYYAPVKKNTVRVKKSHSFTSRKWHG